METRSATSPMKDLVRTGIGPVVAAPDGSVLDLFEATVARAPQRPAVRFRDRVYTFGELDERVNAIALRLLTKGVVTGSFVPLAVTGGTEFPVGLLAAMKLGAPFVPVDPEWPPSRLDTLFRQLSPPAVLAVEATLPALHAIGMADRAVLIDRVDPATGPATGPPTGVAPGQPLEAAACRRPGPDDLIYGYFTSGSTGDPKCALNRHRGLVNRMAAMSSHFGDGAEQVVLQNSKPTFDSSMWQVLWPLTTGGQVIMPDRRGILDLEQTCHILARHAVTITDFVPSVLDALVNLLELRPDLRAELTGLRRMLIGGEEANPAVLRRLRNLLPGLRVTNTFGPTECSIGSVFHHIEDLTGRIPLGTPIPNTAALVLDDAMRPVPAGTVGEIYIGGVCVGAGYLNDPERTARAFVPNPFPEISGPLLYRTGDLGHHGAAGLLMFDGRRDDQVKVGGVRIELAEVEQMLGGHPAVRSAAVIVRGEGDARSLAAFASLRPDVVVTADALLEWLRQRLPPETMPRTLILVPDIPTTPHGKLDRRALERIARRAAESGSIEPPATVDEELVVAVWREVLALDEISVVTPFASYGGTSLLTHRVAALLTVRRGRAVHPADLLSADTVRGQARLLAANVAPVPVVDVALLERDADPSGLVESAVPAADADPSGVVRSTAPAAAGPARRLLLTGGTGFIGAHLVAELLTRAQIELTCLVRAADPAAGTARLLDALRGYELSGSVPTLERALATGQFRVIAGDLAEPMLGLTEAGFRRLAGWVESVVHAGAMVNFLRDYAGHRGPNVMGTGQLIRLAASGHGCRLHVLSTLSIFSGAAPSGSGWERGLIGDDQNEDDQGGPDRLPDLATPPATGYDQSKLVAEHLLARARSRGIDSVVYRLGEVWPHRETGVPNRASLAHSLVYAAARTRVVFPTTARTDHIAVDVLARHLADAAVGERPAAEIASAIRPVVLRYAEIFERLAQAGAEPLGYAEFRSRLTALAEREGVDDRLVRVAMLLPPAEGITRAAPAAFDRLFHDGSVRPAPPDGSPMADMASFLRRLHVES